MDKIKTRPVPPEDEIHLIDFLMTLIKHSRMIIYTSTVVTLLTFLLLFIQPNKYTAVARLLPPQQNFTLSAQLLNSLGGGVIPGAATGAVGGGMAANILGIKSSSDLYVDMMAGNTVLDRIIERFNLREIYKAKYIEAARQVLSKNAKIMATKDGLLTIEVTDTNPKRAAEMAYAFSEELGNLLQRIALREAKSRLAFLEKERLQTNQNLTNAENVLRTFCEQNGVIQIDTQTRGTLEYIARMRAEIDNKEVQIGVLRYQATSSNSEMVQLEMELNGLKEKLQAAECNQIPGTDVCLTSSKVPTLGLEYSRLYREVKFQEGLYQLYTKMLELARIDVVKDFAVVPVVDVALPPEVKSNKRLLPAMLAGIISFFMMIFFGFFCEYFQNASQAADDAKWQQLKHYVWLWQRDARRLLIFIRFKKT